MEDMTNPKAKAALDKEWDRLRSSHTWDGNGVCEWSDFAAEGRKTTKPEDMGRVFAILVQNNSELA
eukprot:12443046-Prorocentrum_lima.AAC.1